MKVCKRCNNEIQGKRISFCGERCKYIYWSIKKDNERYMPPVRKRNVKYFHMYQRTQMKKGQGKRCGQMVTGAMSVGTEAIFIVEIATLCNLFKHFNRSEMIKSAEFCNGQRLRRIDFFCGNLLPKN